MADELLVFQFSKAKTRLALLLFGMFVLAACAGTAGEGEEPEPTLDLPILYPVNEDYVYVDAGSFYMGSTDEDLLARDDEKPLHIVRLNGFWIWQREVSNTQYKECVDAGICTTPTDFGEGPSSYYNNPKYLHHPVVGVDWYQAAAYCEWRDARLPTEAEWEKAARGEQGLEYPWGNEWDVNKANTGNDQNEDQPLVPVGTYKTDVSPYGVFDMGGNVSEWVADWYQPYPGATYNDDEYGEKHKVVRGGGAGIGHYALSIFFRSARRQHTTPRTLGTDVGFRCVQDT